MAPDNQRYRVLQRRASQRIISFGVSDAAIRRRRQKVAAGFSALRLGIVNCVFLKVCYTLDYDATEHCTSFMRDAVLLDDFKAVFPTWYRIHPVSDTVCDRERPVSFLQSGI